MSRLSFNALAVYSPACTETLYYLFHRVMQEESVRRSTVCLRRSGPNCLFSTQATSFFHFGSFAKGQVYFGAAQREHKAALTVA